MEANDLDAAIRRLCGEFRWPTRVEILIVGGAAGMLTGVLAADRVTGDVDVMVYHPAEAMAEVERLADDLGRRSGLPQGWFNSNVQIRTDTLPDGWAARRQLVDTGECLWVFAASRQDLLAMKFLAHRPQDLEDIEAIGVSVDDVRFVRQYLAALAAKGTRAADVADAVAVLKSWRADAP